MKRGMKMTEPITINALLQIGGIIAAFWGGYAKKTKTKNENT
jgi:hypothetical protein